MEAMKHWSGRWIEYPACAENATAVFEKEFDLACAPARAYVEISGLGFYILEINGARATDDLLPPAFTAYDKTVLYNRYDVAPLLGAGRNVLRVTLGNGWYHEPGTTALTSNTQRGKTACR
jgi:alpha-L-rhamnosidase